MTDIPNQPKFDAFLSHNSQDKPAVEAIARRLETEAELKVWLDKWNSVPGEDAIEELETAIGQSRACVVFLGPSGIGSWHKAEIQAALRKNIRDKNYSVIPVLLPEAPTPTGNDFLLNFGWVDFREKGLQDEEEFRRLVRGISGNSSRESSIATTSHVGTLRSHKRWWILLAAVLLVASLTLFYWRTKAVNTSEPTPAMIVIVKDAQGSPVASAVVEIDALPGKQFLTKPDGAVAIENIPRKPLDRIGITVSKNGKSATGNMAFPNPNSDYITLP